ncbi:MAG: phosphotransferase [Planctomycetota bacterium]
MPDLEPQSATHAEATEAIVSETLSAVPSAAGSGVADGAPDHARFATEELAMVLSHYDIGPIDKIKPFPRGSRKAPKSVLRSAFGLFLLKRRAKGKENPHRVAFCHSVQLHLMDRQFPLPRLLGTRRDNNSMLKLNGQVYELFEFIRGNPYDQSLEATTDAGRVLGLMHRLLDDFDCPYESSSGSFHNSSSVKSALEHAPHALRRVYGDAVDERGQELADGLAFLRHSYAEAADRAEAKGLSTWPTSVVHSDFHPGNLLYRGSRVVAVIDFDSARRLPRVVDVANGALQFSILGGRKPSEWPEYLDETRFRRFVRGYESVPDTVLNERECEVVVSLMIEALIAEVAVPIAQTGRFGTMSGMEVFDVVGRKVRWLLEHEPRLTEALAE